MFVSGKSPENSQTERQTERAEFRGARCRRLSLPAADGDLASGEVGLRAVERMRGTGRAHAARLDCTNPHLAARTEAPASHPQTLRLPQPLMHHSLRRPVPYPHHCLASAACARHVPHRRTARRPTSALTLTMSPCAHSNGHAHTRPCT